MRAGDREGGRKELVLRQARLAARALEDRALLDAMRAADPWAWLEFDERFRPLLERYAVHAEIPAAEWPVCIGEVMADEGVRLTLPGVEPPRQLRAYLVRAVRNRYLRLKRATAVRERHHAALATGGDGEHVVRVLCSEYALRTSAGALDPAPDDDYAAAATRLTRALTRELGADDLALLGWAAECVPHRTIAEWTGASYDATTKRIWRLCQRLRRRACEIVAAWPEPDERAAIARMTGISMAMLDGGAAREKGTEGRAHRSGGAER